MSEIKNCPYCGSPRYLNGQGVHLETGTPFCPVDDGQPSKTRRVKKLTRRIR